jgi:hypothetical protein
MSAKKTDSLAAGKIINNSCICRSDALREREREREGGERKREREREREDYNGAGMEEGYI